MSAAELHRQQALVQAILGAADGGPASVPGLVAVSGGAVGIGDGLMAYRANAKALAKRALAAAYPRLLLQLGDAQFAAMAWQCWRDMPPQQGEIGIWASGLPGFLARQRGFPAMWLDCARLEAAAIEVERAEDVALDAGSLQLLGSLAAEALRIELRPGLALLSVCAGAARLWPLPELDDVGDTQPASALLWRRAWRAELAVLQRAEAEMIRPLLQGESLAQALEAALTADAGFDFSAWLQQALLLGWLWRVLRIEESVR